ncbi:uncharacterized protein TNCV_3566541 [Trichonephila clavipes]|nr:uncharacterized protein TNCV_3566541 [Trichonephila clavipes]
MNESMIELSSYTNKGTQYPGYLRKVTLETIHKIQCDDLQIYADGSMDEGAILGSGIFIKMGNGIIICMKNLDYCSVFRAELLATEEALKCCITECQYRYLDIE